MLSPIKTLLLAGLMAGASTAALAETPIKVSATPAIFKPMFEAFVTAFEAKHPDIKVELIVPPGEQEAAVQEILRLATVNELPDVSFQGYNYIRTLAERDLPVPLNDFIARDADWAANYSPSVANSGTIGGTTFGLGVGISFPVLYYNADVVKQALGDGVPFPDSWEGIVELARKIQSLRPDLIGGYYLANPWIFQAHVESLGGHLMNKDETAITFDGPEGLQAFEVMKAFGEAGQAAAQMTREQGRQAFDAGTLGIFTDSSSILSQHQEQIGTTFKLGVAPLPVNKQLGSIPAAGIASLMLTKDPAKQDAAWAFMTFASSAEAQLIVAQNTAYIPANAKALAASPELKALFAAQPLMQPALDTVPYASAWFAFPGGGAKADKAILDAMSDVLALRVEPAAALAGLKTTIEGIMAE